MKVEIEIDIQTYELIRKYLKSFKDGVDITPASFVEGKIADWFEVQLESSNDFPEACPESLTEFGMEFLANPDWYNQKY